jgi:hypothetical protein
MDARNNYANKPSKAAPDSALSKLDFGSYTLSIRKCRAMSNLLQSNRYLMMESSAMLA